MCACRAVHQSTERHPGRFSVNPICSNSSTPKFSALDAACLACLACHPSLPVPCAFSCPCVFLAPCLHPFPCPCHCFCLPTYTFSRGDLHAVIETPLASRYYTHLRHLRRSFHPRRCSRCPYPPTLVRLRFLHETAQSCWTHTRSPWT